MTINYAVLSKAIIIHEDISKDLPYVFGDPIVAGKVDGTPMFMFKRDHLLDMYIMTRCDERFSPEEMEKWYDKNNSY